MLYKGQKFSTEQCVCYCIWLDDCSRDNLSEKETLLVTCHNCLCELRKWLDQGIYLYLATLALVMGFCFLFFPHLDLCCSFWYNLSKLLSSVVTRRGPSNSIWHFNNTHLYFLLCLRDFRGICIPSYTPKQLEKKDSWNKGIFNCQWRKKKQV